MKRRILTGVRFRLQGRPGDLGTGVGMVLTALLFVGTPCATGQIPDPPAVQPATLTFWEPAPSYVIDCAINNRGDVIGTVVDRVRGGVRGFLLKGDALEPFSVPGFRTTVLTGINDHGDIVGYVSNPGQHETGFVLRGGVVRFLPPIPPPPGAVIFPGYITGDINNRGAVAGSAHFIINNKLITMGWIYQDGAYALVRYGTNEVTGLTGINDQGQAAGYTSVAGGGSTLQPFIYRHGEFSILPPPTPPRNPNFTNYGFIATAINDRGEVLVTQPPLGVTPTRGSERSYLYRRDGTYADLTPVGSFENVARSINDRGQICGVWLTTNVQDISGEFVWRSIGFVRPAP